jgi:hypothetical protein
MAADRDDHPGERLEVRGCDLFEFKDDKIARKDSLLEARRAVTCCRDDAPGSLGRPRPARGSCR